MEVYSEDWKRDFAQALKLKIEIKCRRFDILQAHYILNPEGRHQLETLCMNYFNATLPEKDKWESEGERSIYIYKLADILKKELQDNNLEKIYFEIDDPLIPVLAKMENKGVLVNPHFFKEFEEDLLRELEILQKKIFAHNQGESFNLNSPKQVGKLLFERLKMPIIKTTKTGPSTDNEVLEKLAIKNINPVVEMILKYRELGKLLSTYVKTIPTLLHPETGRIHTTFDQKVAVTGRLVSNNPNLQNIPIRTERGRKVRKGSLPSRARFFWERIIPKLNCVSWPTLVGIKPWSIPSPKILISTSKPPVKSPALPLKKLPWRSGPRPRR